MNHEAAIQQSLETDGKRMTSGSAFFEHQNTPDRNSVVARVYGLIGELRRKGNELVFDACESSEDAKEVVSSLVDEVKQGRSLVSATHGARKVDCLSSEDLDHFFEALAFASRGSVTTIARKV